MLKFFNLDTVYHVGTLQGHRNKLSLEGDLISISLFPNEWTQIAKLGGNPIKELKLNEALFVDMLSLEDHLLENKELLQPLINDGFLEESNTFRAYQYDDEMESWGYTSHRSYEDALYELELDEGEASEPIDDCPSPNKCLICELSEIIPTQKGKELLGRASQCASESATAFVFILKTPLPDNVCGLYWNETYDPDRLSCPRGGIFPEKLPLFELNDVTSTLSLNEFENRLDISSFSLQPPQVRRSLGMR